MIKRITILTRKPGMSKEDFLKHWKDHLPISRDVPEMRRYVINHITSQPHRADVPQHWEMGEVDGIAETWWDDQASTDRAFASPEGKRWLAHGASFIGRQKTFVVEEEVVIQ
jgi:uncharacterized protein (TIGR02118 family)